MVNLGGTQKVDFLGTCFGGAGLGLNSWAMISLMGEGSALRCKRVGKQVPKKSTFGVPALVVKGWV